MTRPDPQKLRITNARENNLKAVSLEIPHDALTVVTGLSGSGKSSLAFDTVYAEGQRRYIETFSPYTRQFFDKVKKPDVDRIENVRPAIAIQQRTRITSSRSTVGSMTNLNDYLKLLWANLATPICPLCGIEFRSYTPAEVADTVQKWSAEKSPSTYLICAALTVGRKTPAKKPAKKGKKKRISEEPVSAAKLVDALSSRGFSRFFDAETGSVQSFEDFPVPPLFNGNTLFVVLDRLRSPARDLSDSGKEQTLKRLRESAGQAFALVRERIAEDVSGVNACTVIEIPFAESAGAPSNKLLSTRRPFRIVFQGDHALNVPAQRFQRHEFPAEFRCTSGAFSIPPKRPSLFSFNHPLGACDACKGFGNVLAVDVNRCIPNPGLSLRDKAIQCWAGAGARIEYRDLLRFCEQEEIPLDVPWTDLTTDQHNKVLHTKSKDFWGLFPWFAWLEKKTYKMHVRVFLSRYRSQVQCAKCRGTRLKEAALAYQIRRKTLPDLWQMPVGDLQIWVHELSESLRSALQLSRPLAELFKALLARIQFLSDLGLTYLTLDRQARTLSGGETQRVNLAAALGSELVSTQFVLDEPSVGLHPRDTARLIDSVRALSERGNSVLVVEHDLDCIAAADSIIELGPEAGKRGGEVTYSGTTAAWHGIEIEPPLLRATDISNAPSLDVRSATARNLKRVNVRIPLGMFVALTGVSGSGKSTLVHEVLMRAYARFQYGLADEGAENLVTGFENLAQVLLIDQTPLAKSPRANIGTYSGIWDEMRTLLAQTDDAHTRALSKSAFSFNVDGGRCPACKGAGFIREDMQFLSDVYIPCELCLGKRFQRSVLEVRLFGHDVSELLDMTLDQCRKVFATNDRIAGPAALLSELGLGHLTVGHPLSELSGGEAQRLKLVPVIHESGDMVASKGTLLIFDEPTTGLHYHDVQRLIKLFRSLVARGHSILCIEHNLALIAASDWIIDLGPEGGSAGGNLLGAASPVDFASAKYGSKSKTAEYLSKFVQDCQPARRGARPLSPYATGRAKSKRGAPEFLEIQGAREHNLKGIDVSLPLGKIVAITGVSGSGKSTIAKDIIYAEGQRRYLDCLSPYARQFIKELHRPEIDHIENVKPTVCVYQHTFQPSRLSTVATMSEVYNFLRLLYAKAGIQYCPDHPQCRIAPLSVEEMSAQIRSINEKTVRLLAPVIKSKKGNHRAVLERAVSSEIAQVRVDGVFFSTRTLNITGGLERNKAHSIDFVIGKFNPSQLDDELLRDVIAQTLSLGGGSAIVHTDKGESVLSTERACPICKKGFFKPDPEDLSFNSKRGRCLTCEGKGRVEQKKRGEEPTEVTCPDCHGARIGSLGRNLKIDGQSIYDLTLLTSSEIVEFLNEAKFDVVQGALAQPILRELVTRAETLTSIGLDYLPLSRDCNTLSGGELQRLRLATAMSSSLSGALYIFDEPSAGLHPLENEKVLALLSRLKELNNSVLLIEHDTESILSAEHVIDVGPGGGQDGGQIVFNGPLTEFLSVEGSATARAIRAPLPTLADEQRATPRERGKSAVLKVRKGTIHNLENLNVDVPLNSLVGVAGVSGAGKSSFVHHLIRETMTESAESLRSWRWRGTSVESNIEITRVLEVNQKPIGINSRSTPASYLKIWDQVRELFANTNEARARGWKGNFFSYNAGKGRCPECKGLGQVTLEMSFLPDANVECESCMGARYGDEALSVRYLGLNPSEVLRLTFEEAKGVFANHRRIHQSLHLACELGLGYLTLGQSSTTLSGGESQRIKLVAELSGTPRGHTLYILDEPTTGLHKSDVARLIKILRELLARGNSLIVIEHDPDVLLLSDHIIEFGPGPGERGGKIVFQGPPADLAQAGTAWSTALSRSRVLAPARTAANSQ